VSRAATDQVTLRRMLDPINMKKMAAKPW